jgi:hypothetical protein
MSCACWAGLGGLWMSSHCHSIHTLSKMAGGSEINNNNNNPWPECEQTVPTEQLPLVI